MNEIRKGYFHSTTLMQSFLNGFCSERQSRARCGRTGGGFPRLDCSFFLAAAAAAAEAAAVAAAEAAAEAAAAAAAAAAGAVVPAVVAGEVVSAGAVPFPVALACKSILAAASSIVFPRPRKKEPVNREKRILLVSSIIIRLDSPPEART